MKRVIVGVVLAAVLVIHFMAVRESIAGGTFDIEAYLAYWRAAVDWLQDTDHLLILFILLAPLALFLAAMERLGDG